MPLIACPECENSVSAAAESCPKCGHPLRRTPDPAQSSGSASAPPKRYSHEPGPLRRAIGGLVLLGLVCGIGYKMLGRDERDTLNTLASATGITVTPWVDRAETAARAMFQGTSGTNIVHSIQGITHPTGESPVLRDVSIQKLGDILVARWTVDWRGGFLGGSYTTVVEWRCNKTQNLGIRIVTDSAVVGIADANRRQLENYFQQQVYTVLLANAG